MLPLEVNKIMKMGTLKYPQLDFKCKLKYGSRLKDTYDSKLILYLQAEKQLNQRMCYTCKYSSQQIRRDAYNSPSQTPQMQSVLHGGSHLTISSVIPVQFDDYMSETNPLIKVPGAGAF